MSHTFPNAPASPEEDEEKEICGSSRGEDKFISDLCGGVFPKDQVTTVEEKEEDVEVTYIFLDAEITTNIFLDQDLDQEYIEKSYRPIYLALIDI